jgi:hypothetical protein
MRFSKEIKALAKRIAKAEFVYAREMYEEDDDGGADVMGGVSERTYVVNCEEHVGSLIVDEIAIELEDTAAKEYRRLVRAKYGRK